MCAHRHFVSLFHRDKERVESEKSSHIDTQHQQQQLSMRMPLFNWLNNFYFTLALVSFRCLWCGVAVVLFNVFFLSPFFLFHLTPRKSTNARAIYVYIDVCIYKYREQYDRGIHTGTNRSNNKTQMGEIDIFTPLIDPSEYVYVYMENMWRGSKCAIWFLS